jgi:hypothetical protein
MGMLQVVYLGVLELAVQERRYGKLLVVPVEKTDKFVMNYVAEVL